MPLDFSVFPDVGGITSGSFDINLLERARKEREALYIPFVPHRAITSEPIKSVSNWTRFGERFVEGLVPFGVNADLPKAESTGQVISEVLGGLIGTGLGFIGISFLTGGTGAPAYVLKAGKAYKAVRGTSKMVSTASKAQKLINGGKSAQVAARSQMLMRTGKGAEGFVMARELVKAEKFTEATAAFGMASKGILGKSPTHLKNVLSLTAARGPQAAQLYNAGVSNLLTFGAHSQLYLPPASDMETRLKSLTSSAIQSLMFTSVGALRIYKQFPKFVDEPLVAAGVHTAEAGMLLGIGAGSDLGQSDMTVEERLIHGLSLVAFHYAMKGANKVGVESQMRVALEAAGYRDPIEINRIVKAGTNVVDTAIQKATGKEFKEVRSPEKQQIYKEKETDSNIDLLKVYSRSDGKGVVLYHDLATNEVKRIFGESASDALSKFKSKYEFVSGPTTEIKVTKEPASEGKVRFYKAELGEGKEGIEVDVSSPRLIGAFNELFGVKNKEGKKTVEYVDDAIITTNEATGKRSKIGITYEVTGTKEKGWVAEGRITTAGKKQVSFELGPYKRRPSEYEIRRIALKNAIEGIGGIPGKVMMPVQRKFSVIGLESIPSKEKQPGLWGSWNRYRGKVRGNMEKVDAPIGEVKELMTEIYPESKGSTTNMTGKQLHFWNETITPESKSKMQVREFAVRAPLGTIEKISLKAKKFLDEVTKHTLPVHTTMMLTKNGAMIEIGRDKMLPFELMRQRISGRGVEIDSILKEVTGQETGTKITLKDLNVGVLNDKFGDFVPKNLSDKQKANNKVAKELMTAFYNEMFTEMAMNGVEVRRLVKKNYSYAPIFSVYDKKGNIIKLKNDSDVMGLVNEKIKIGDEVVNQRGNKIKVGKVEHAHQSDYITLQLTRKAKIALDQDDNFKRRVHEHVAASDPEIQSALRAGKITKDEAVILAAVKFSEYSAWAGQKGVFGRQYSRVADLPPQFAWDSEGVMIDLTNFNVKKGNVVTDIHGSKRTVGKVIDVYERDMSKIIGSYAQQVAHITATYKYYGRDGVGGKKIRPLLEQVNSEMGDRWGRWAYKQVKTQANTEPAGPVSRFFSSAAKLTSNIGLSSPTSGAKNAMLAEVNIYTAFGFSNMMRAYNDFLARPGAVKEWVAITRAIGGTEIGVHEIITAPYARFSPGLMRPTEISNRIRSVVVGDFAARTALDVLTGNKTPSSALMSKSTARHLLETTFKLKNVDGIIARESKSVKRMNTIAKKDGKISKYQPKFTESEITQARQMAHLVTQGGPSLPFIPGWMAKPIAKPLTLFYRIAYRVTENVINNAVKPMIVQGNPIPLMRYVAASTATGWALYSMYYHILGREKNRFKNASARYWMNFIRGEGLMVASNAFDEYGGAVDTYEPVIFRTMSSIANETGYILSGTKKPYDAGVDWLKRNVVIFNHTQQAWRNLSKSPLSDVKHFNRLRAQFEEEIFGARRTYGDVAQPTTKTPYYRAIRDVFWTDNREDKAQAYWAAVAYVANELEKENYTPIGARVEAKIRIKSIISNMRPIPESWKKRGKRKESRYITFRRYLDDDDMVRLQGIDSKYILGERDFWGAVNKYKSKYGMGEL